jgi:hypothetical protein
VKPSQQRRRVSGSAPAGQVYTIGRVAGLSSDHQGYQTRDQQTARVDFQLRVGTNEVVNVEVNLCLVESTATGQSLEQQVTNLPLNVRQFMQMVFLRLLRFPPRGITGLWKSRDTSAPAGAVHVQRTTTIKSMVLTTRSQVGITSVSPQ